MNKWKKTACSSSSLDGSTLASDVFVPNIAAMVFRHVCRFHVELQLSFEEAIIRLCSSA
jgi:hypothetical protein